MNNTLTDLIKSFRPDQEGFLYMWVLLAILILAVLFILERFIALSRSGNINAAVFMKRIIVYLRDQNYDAVINLCQTAGKRSLPKLVKASILQFIKTPSLIRQAMEETLLSEVSLLEKRISYIAAMGNISTLIGLMGTIYGLILAFNAVGSRSIEPAMKSSFLAQGISAAMNTTLLGLIIAIPCVITYSYFRNRIDQMIGDIDKYAKTILKILMPEEESNDQYRPSSRRKKPAVEADPNLAPMMNLMVCLIPLLLTSAEFVKMGIIEIKLPPALAASEEIGGEEMKPVLLDLILIITEEGINIQSALPFFLKAKTKSSAEQPPTPDITKKDGKYDFLTLTRKLAQIKKEVLFSYFQRQFGRIEEVSLLELDKNYNKIDKSNLRLYPDNESIKIIASPEIDYQTVVSVMDAARYINTDQGPINLFPSVSMAGGIVEE